MARVESREKKKSNMSIIAQCCPYFHCQRIRPTQLVDPQLIMYFLFILRLLNNIFVTWSCWSMTCYESLATHVFRITVFWIIENVTFQHRKRYHFTIYTPLGYKKHNHFCKGGPPGFCCRLFPRESHKGHWEHNLMGSFFSVTLL